MVAWFDFAANNTDQRRVRVVEEDRDRQLGALVGVMELDLNH